MNNHFNVIASRSINSQQGVVIIVALVTLVVMTMVGLTSIGNATLQERMAANNRFYFQARLNAETALREAEDYLSGRVDATVVFNDAQDVIDLFTQSDVDHLYLNTNVSKSSSAVLQTPSLDSNLASKTSWPVGTASLAVPVANGSNDSRYIIEYIGTIDYSAISGSERVDISDGTSSLPSTEPWAFRITAIGYSSNSNIYSVLESIYATQTR